MEPMKTIQRNEIYEESVWVWECPECKGNNTEETDPNYGDDVVCTLCGETILIEE